MTLSTTPKPVGRFRRWVSNLWKLFLGVLFCQHLLTSLLVVGWLYRLMARRAVERWEKTARPGRLVLSPWPRWILHEDMTQTLEEGKLRKQRVRFFFKAVFHSLFLNFKMGFQGTVNTWVLTLPACFIWMVAWNSGWNNSFAKGYEQSAQGLLLGLLGVALFILAMLYVPLAQARQASTGKAVSFYQFRLLWALVRRKRLAWLFLALAFAAAALPITISRVAPTFLAQGRPLVVDGGPAGQLKFLNDYFFWITWIAFPLYLVVHLLAAKIYASAMAALATEGALPLEPLYEEEKNRLESLGLFGRKEKAKRHALVLALQWTASRTGRVVCMAGAVGFWFLFVAQIFITQFLGYYPVAWLNQPLVQLPCFRHVPEELEKKAQGKGDDGMKEPYSGHY